MSSQPTQPEAPTPTEEQFKLLKRIDRRAKTDCPMAVYSMPLGSASLGRACLMYSLRWIDRCDFASSLSLTTLGESILSRGIATNPCLSDDCTEIFEFEVEHEEVDYCSERCEAEQRARDAGDWLHDAAKEGG